MPDETGGGEEKNARTRGGWRFQRPILKVLLFASLAALVIGVVRCSIEMTPTAAEAEEHLEIATVLVSVPKGVVATGGGSAAEQVTGRFLEKLGLPVRADSGEEGTTSGAREALVSVTVRLIEEDLEISAEIRDPEARETLASADASGPREALHDLVDLVAAKLRAELGLPADESGPRIDNGG